MARVTSLTPLLLVLLRSFHAAGASLLRHIAKRWHLLFAFIRRHIRFCTCTINRNRPPSHTPPPSTPEKIPWSSEEVVVCPSYLPTSASTPNLSTTARTPPQILTVDSSIARPAHVTPYNSTATVTHYTTRSYQDIPSTSRTDPYATLTRREHDARRLQAIQADAVHDRLLSPRGSRAPTRAFLGDASRSSSRARSPSPSRMQGAISTPLSSASRLDVTLAGTHSSPRRPYSALTSEGTTANGSHIDVQVQPPSPTGSDYSAASIHGSQGSFVSPMTMPVLLEGRTPLPIYPDDGPRYARTHNIPRYDDNYVIPMLTTSWPHSPDGDDEPQGWTPVVHPDGALYFYHNEKRIYTDNYLYKSEFLEEITQAVEYLEKCMQALEFMSFVKTKDYELFLNVEYGDSLIQWKYYYVDHTSRCIFWLHEFDMTHYASAVPGTKSPAHMRLRLESAYWHHWFLYPVGHDRNLSVEDHDDLMGTLKFLCLDAMTSALSTTPYSADELHRMISLLQRAKEPGSFDVYMICSVARLKGNICLWKHVQYHGQRGARLSRNQSVHGPTKQARTLLIQIFSMFLFRSPIGCLNDIEKIQVDSVISLPSWRTYVEKLQAEWQDFILCGTVLLTVNIAFLAVPLAIVFPNNDMTPGPQNLTQSYDRPLRSPSGIASVVSAILSIACMFQGLLLVRYNRTKSRDEAGDAALYMHRLKTRRFGFEPLAIIYSLPWAFLMWAIIAFFATMLIFTFQYMEWVAQASVAVTSAITVAFILWCVFVECQTSDNAQKRIQRVRNACATLVSTTSKWIQWIQPKKGGAVDDVNEEGDDEGDDEKDEDVPEVTFEEV